MTADRGRRPIIGGNWKMNTVLPGAIDLAEGLVRQLGDVVDAEVVIFPPFPNLAAVHTIIDASTLQLGAQDVFWEEKGAFTGEVSAAMLSAVGCEWILVGHSERRGILGESDEIVNRKVHAVLKHGLQTILAVGETREQRQSGRTEVIIEGQLRGGLANVSPHDMGSVVIAYEPCWAIGTGETATPEQARQAHAFTRSVIRDLYDQGIADAIRIQYGGSVTGQNAVELMSQPGIDGALVGGASLKPDDFVAIVRAAAASARV